MEETPKRKKRSKAVKKIDSMTNAVTRIKNFYFIDKSGTLSDWCSKSTTLYNDTIQLLEYQNDRTVFNTFSVMKHHPSFVNLPKAKVAQKTVKIAALAWKSYEVGHEKWTEDPSNFCGEPKKPEKTIRVKPVIFDYQCSSIKDGKIHLTKNFSIILPNKHYFLDDFQEIRIIPSIFKNKFKIEIVYYKDIGNYDPDRIDKEKYLSIDLGISNFVSMVDSDENCHLIKGTNLIRYVNQYSRIISKSRSNYLSFKKKDKKMKVRRTRRFHADKRNKRVSDELHKISRMVVNYCLQHKIGNIVIGYSKGWKSRPDLPKNVNRLFCGIGHKRFIHLLKYKANDEHISVHLQYEGYTSKCDFLANEPIHKHKKYLGKRIERGLFSSSTNKLINSDINGACNILSKFISRKNLDTTILDKLRKGNMYMPSKLFVHTIGKLMRKIRLQRSLSNSKTEQILAERKGKNL